jgi:hypothetical protein
VRPTQRPHFAPLGGGDGKADGDGGDAVVVTDGALAGVAITRVDPTAAGPLTQFQAAEVETDFECN